ncbi:BT_3928 family protein [Capnocytophaga canimorsus]|uniref:BT_3928 family protein n=1 Tax=Capnocytophaga canimorsus TaxID=28188 RepID=UPI00385D01DC
MKYLIHLIRLIVGVIFIISGLIKLNDPVGFAFKLEEYFSAQVLNLPFLEPLALVLAISVCIAEVLLGVMLLLGYAKKVTLWSLLAMLVFFAFLTFYSAYYNKVTDCGCFGDAIKFTPWQSFTKDMVLMAMTLMLFWGQKYISPITEGSEPIFVTLMALVACIFFVMHVYNHLPVVDFRAYKVGTNIPEGMQIPENAPQPKFTYHWKFQVDGKEQVITTMGDYPKVEGQFLEVKTEEIDKGYVPPIHDFTIEKEDFDYTSEFMQEEKMLLVVCYRLDKAEKKAFKTIKEVTDKALKAGYKVVGMTYTLPLAETIVKDFELNFDFYLTDETTLKTIIRSNPGLVLLNKGTIIDKKHFNDATQLQL